jgi:succinyl-diaminopimelate desuccinylase
MTQPSELVDPVALTAALIRCKSVTPIDDGALDLLVGLLEPAGFNCSRVDRNGTVNLFARWGEGKNGPTLGFNGHTDVVPIGDVNAWQKDPFGGVITDGKIWGRGACDMKSGVAAFAAAAIDFVTDTPPDGSIVLAITGDEEGIATDGTTAILDWMATHGERIDHCLVGEPTCPNEMGEMIKIGRRGSMTAFFTIAGVMGHSAYPHRAKNPVHAIVNLMDKLANHTLDEGTDHFDASTLVVTTVDVGNAANNVIPGKATGTVNIRFNDAHSSETLCAWLQDAADACAEIFGVSIDMRFQISGESFLTPPGPLSDMVVDAVEDETGRRPVLSTSGGTSDARFIKDHCPVVEVGLVGKSMHQVDEYAEVDHIIALKSIYSRVLRSYFG